MQAGCHTRPAISPRLFRALTAQTSRGEIANPTLVYVRVGRADEARGELRILGRCTGRPTAGLASCYCKLLLLPVLQRTLFGRASLAAPRPRDLSAPIIHFALLRFGVAALDGFRRPIIGRLRTILKESHEACTSFPPKCRQDCRRIPYKKRSRTRALWVHPLGHTRIHSVGTLVSYHALRSWSSLLL